eukprot:sb/3466896/
MIQTCTCILSSRIPGNLELVEKWPSYGVKCTKMGKKSNSFLANPHLREMASRRRRNAIRLDGFRKNLRKSRKNCLRRNAVSTPFDTVYTPSQHRLIPSILRLKQFFLDFRRFFRTPSIRIPSGRRLDAVSRKCGFAFLFNISLIYYGEQRALQVQHLHTITCDDESGLCFGECPDLIHLHRGLHWQNPFLSGEVFPPCPRVCSHPSLQLSTLKYNKQVNVIRPSAEKGRARRSFSLSPSVSREISFSFCLRQFSTLYGDLITCSGLLGPQNHQKIMTHSPNRSPICGSWISGPRPFHIVLALVEVGAGIKSLSHLVN